MLIVIVVKIIIVEPCIRVSKDLRKYNISVREGRGYSPQTMLDIYYARAVL